MQSWNFPIKLLFTKFAFVIIFSCTGSLIWYSGGCQSLGYSPGCFAGSTCHHVNCLQEARILNPNVTVTSTVKPWLPSTAIKKHLYIRNWRLAVIFAWQFCGPCKRKTVLMFALPFVHFQYLCMYRVKSQTHVDTILNLSVVKGQSLSSWLF